MTPSETPSPGSVPALDVERATRLVEIDGGSFPVLEHGNGPVVLLLHGFPDSRYLWRYQAPALAEAGFRVVAPDLRGFGDAPKPDAVDAYELANVVDDVTTIAAELGIETVRLVGHDWGADVAWLLAATQPKMVERLVALSVGAPGNSKTRTIEQRERLWYAYFFLFEGVAEAWLQHDDWQLFREWTRGQGDQERYLEDLSRPGALTAGLNWYRANFTPRPPSESGVEYPDVTRPVMGVWSDGDFALTEGHMIGSEEKVDGPWRYEKLTGAGHWMMLDKPAELNELLIDFFAGSTNTN